MGADKEKQEVSDTGRVRARDLVGLGDLFLDPD